MATGQVLFHRFYCKKSFTRFNVKVWWILWTLRKFVFSRAVCCIAWLLPVIRPCSSFLCLSKICRLLSALFPISNHSVVLLSLQDVAASCVWLASKLEESPKEISVVLQVLWRMERRRNNLPLEILDLNSQVCSFCSITQFCFFFFLFFWCSALLVINLEPHVVCRSTLRWGLRWSGQNGIFWRKWGLYAMWSTLTSLSWAIWRPFRHLWSWCRRHGTLQMTGNMWARNHFVNNNFCRKCLHAFLAVWIVCPVLEFHKVVLLLLLLEFFWCLFVLSDLDH